MISALTVFILILLGLILFPFGIFWAAQGIYRKDRTRGIRGALVGLLACLLLFFGVILGGAAVVKYLWMEGGKMMRHLKMETDPEDMDRRGPRRKGPSDRDANGTGTGEILERLGGAFGEFITAQARGLNDRLILLKIFPRKNLRNLGISLGRSRLNPGEKKNTLSVYLIFDRAFKGGLILKAFDRRHREFGRVLLRLDKRKNSAGYEDFVFDPRTDLPIAGYCTLEAES